jgi:hypothetical protein
VRAEVLLRAAVTNNAGWCDAVCRSHGYPGEFTARTWISPRHGLPFYPNAITLSPEATAADTQATRAPGRAYAVKDSFACLDLASEGLAPLFDADWIAWEPAPPERPPAGGPSWKTVEDAGQLARWEAAWAAGTDVSGLFLTDLLSDPGCVFLGCYRGGVPAGGAIAYTAAQVTGISNVFSTGLPDGLLWPSAVRAVAALRPGLPVVGYESGEDLAAAREAGGRVLGPLRIWTRGSAVP